MNITNNELSVLTGQYMEEGNEMGMRPGAYNLAYTVQSEDAETGQKALSLELIKNEGEPITIKREEFMEWLILSCEYTTVEVPSFEDAGWVYSTGTNIMKVANRIGYDSRRGCGDIVVTSKVLFDKLQHMANLCKLYYSDNIDDDLILVYVGCQNPMRGDFDRAIVSRDIDDGNVELYVPNNGNVSREQHYYKLIKLVDNVDVNIE